MANFDLAIKYLANNEGGYVNLPDDRGGPTNFGITITSLANWLKRPVTADDIKNLDPMTARKFYQETFWNPSGLQFVLNDGMATAIFDTAVLYGLKTAGKFTQRACNACGCNLTVDGVIGPSTVASLNIINPDSFIKCFHAYIIDRIDAIISNDASQSTFQKGWEARADRLLNLV